MESMKAAIREKLFLFFCSLHKRTEKDCRRDEPMRDFLRKHPSINAVIFFITVYELPPVIGGVTALVFTHRGSGVGALLFVVSLYWVS